jgi:hypothetical protein
MAALRPSKKTEKRCFPGFFLKIQTTASVALAERLKLCGTARFSTELKLPPWRPLASGPDGRDTCLS